MTSERSLSPGDPEQEGRAHEARMGHPSDPSRRGRGARRARRSVARRVGPRHWWTPREVGRHRLPARPRRRGDSEGGDDRRRRRLLRGHDRGALLQEGDAPRRRPSRTHPLRGTHFDPEIVRALLSVSIGRLRGAMGIFAGLAHLPFIGPLTTAAAHAPDTLTAAVGATTSGATAGLSMAAIGGALVLGPTTPTTNAFASTPLPST